MPDILIRNVDEHVKDRLRLQAARHGRSMEAEAREILARGVGSEPPDCGAGTLLLRKLAAAGAEGVDLEPPDRSDGPRPVDLS